MRVSRNRLPTEKRAQIIGCLVDGNSIRSTVRITGAAKNTVTKLLVDLGAACTDYQAAMLVDLPCTTIECDEIWAFCYSKQQNVPDAHVGTFGYGDVWTWTALCTDTRLVPSWLVGERTVNDAWAALSDLQGRPRERVQLTSDGHKVYAQAVDLAFGDEIDFAMLHKIYGQNPSPSATRRYRPAVCTGADVRIIKGDPDPRNISTSYVERQNLTMRMGMRRFTRLTNAFSKKVENLAYAVSLHYLHSNFARVHQSLKVTPAMAQGVADHKWSLYEIAALLDSN